MPTGYGKMVQKRQEAAKTAIAKHTAAGNENKLKRAKKKKEKLMKKK